MNDFVTVYEFAEQAGVSTQAIYKQLNRRLKPYVHVVKGRKMLDTAALRDLYGIDATLPEQSVFENQDSSGQSFQSDATESNALLRVIDVLEKQLSEKDKQIADLLRIIDRQL